MAQSTSHAQVLNNYTALLDKSISYQTSNEPLENIIRTITDQLSIGFSYDNSIKAKMRQPVAISSGERKVKNLLEEVLIPKGLTFQVISNQLIISEAKQVHSKTSKGNIAGTLLGMPENIPLGFVIIHLPERRISVLTKEDGSFYIGDIETGNVTLQINCLGYESLSISYMINAGDNLPLSIHLDSKLSELEGVTISGIRLGEVKALNQMQNAENIKYVMSQEQIERFPDLTVGESLQRVPGVAVDYSYGIPRNVIIRGLGQGLSSVTMNGNRLPSTGAGSRTTDLNGILANSIESIEVIKTLTPDRDADGTGGAVNIVTKSPKLDEKMIDAKLAGGYNGLLSRGTYDMGLTYGERKNKWSYLLAASYARNWRAEDRVDKSYSNFTLDGENKILLSNLDLDGYEIKRDNLALNGELKYYASERSTFYLRSSYNKYYEIQNRLERIFNIRSYENETQLRDVRITQSGNWRDYHRDLLQISIGGLQFLQDWRLDYDLTYSLGKYDQPIYYSAGFVRNGLQGTLDLSNPQAPQFNFVQENPFDPSQYTTNRYVNRHDSSMDKDGQYSINLLNSIDLGQIKGNVKFGSRGKYKYNDRFRNYFQHDLITGNFVLSDFLSSYRKDDHYLGAYEMYNFPEAKALESFYQENPGLFRVNDTYTRQNTDPDSFTGHEYLLAFYAMSELNYKSLKVITGLRYEGTGFKYNGNQVNFDDRGEYVSTFPINTNQSFDGLFPSLNLKYALTPHTNIRGAITRSLARPSYYDLVPWEEVETNRQRISMGNPNLTQATAVNYDLLFEHYFRSVGLLSGGVFQKNLRNYIFSTSFTQEGGNYDGYLVRQTVNGADALTRGFELAWQQQLTFLPGFWNGFGVYTNFTYVYSKFEVPGVNSTRTVSLPEMRPHVGNVSLSYEKYGFSGRLSMYFYGTFTSELSEDPNNDLLEQGRKQLDFSASQRLTDRLSIFVGVNNLTNQPISDIFRDGRPQNDAYYSRWGNIGLRFKTY
ncbi:TonB-dependent receptor [Belliella kenyensis]|uniref:TonB-dependent receptor n=2 Tax=Belliella kenyensis TaxID=1472724 RepID=A0ABV8ELQ9_9BACT|nr:TonB-dependent receptor [Belliella kenyensis]MDN3601868.1 TonB-dependent receptor [Belliella kenyensis]